MPKIETIGVGEEYIYKDKEGKDCYSYHVEEIDVLEIRNTNKIQNILNNPDSISLEEINKIKDKQLHGVSKELREKLILLLVKKIKQRAIEEENTKAQTLLDNKENYDDAVLTIHLKLLNFNLIVFSYLIDKKKKR